MDFKLFFKEKAITILLLLFGITLILIDSLGIISLLFVILTIFMIIRTTKV